jgi:flagellar FliL protein
MRKILIMLGALGVLAGGGAGAFFFLKSPAQASETPPKAEEKHTEEKAEEGGDAHGAKPAGPLYVRMDPLVVPVMDSEGISQTVSMVVAFEVEDQAGADKIESLKPRIKDAFIENLYGMLNKQVAMEQGVLKVGYVKQRLNDISVKVLGEGVVKGVLLQIVQQNPI